MLVGTKTRGPLIGCLLSIALIVGAAADDRPEKGGASSQAAAGQGVVENVQSVIRGGVVIVTYDLIADPRAVFTVVLDVSRDGGATFDLRAKSVSGDVGPGIRPGTRKQIRWEATQDVERLDLDNFRYRVVLEGPPPETGVAPSARPSAGLSVTSIPSGARVLVDGFSRGQTPLKLDGLTPGDHRVTLTMEGYLENSRTVRLEAGSTYTLELTLTPEGQRSAAAKPSFAQQDYEKGWIDVNFGIAQSAQDDLTTTYTFTLFREQAALAAVYPKPARGADFDFGGGYMFTPVVGVGLSISGTAHQDAAGLGITVPHPFFFNASASAGGTTEDVLKRTEGTFHIQIVAVPMRSDRLRLRVFGGPSYFRVTQNMVEDISVRQTVTTFSRVNSVSVTGYQASEVEGTGLGFHVGADLGVFFNRVVGVGAMVRFSRGHVDMADPLSETNVELTAGGVQFGGGLRLKF